MPMNIKQSVNILHLFSDQLRFDAIAAHGNNSIKTPNIDRLVAEGVSFQRAYSPSPVCVPARACMITGHYPGRTGCYSNAEPMPPEDQGSFMQRLSDAGYRTHGIGKCHFKPDSQALRGFQSRETQEEIPKTRESDDFARNLIQEGYGWVLEPHGVRGEMYYVPQPSLLPESKHPTNWIGDRSIAFIEKQQGKEQPWYLYSSFVHPHPPFSPPTPWHKLYRGPDMPLPVIPDESALLTSFINRIQNRYKYRDRGIDLNLVRQMRAYYYACITFIDYQIGRILDSLEASGQLDNTLILFSADHGEYLGDYGCFGKRGMHDVSARVPFIVRWPDLSHAGEKPDMPVSLVDIAPSFMEVAGIRYSKEDFDGLAIDRLLRTGSLRDCVFSQYSRGANGLYMAVERRMKYIFSAPDQKELLFDLKQDPLEQVNLANSLAHQEVLNQLRKRCQEWVRSSGQHDALDVNGDWIVYPLASMPADPDEGLIYQDPPWWKGANQTT